VRSKVDAGNFYAVIAVRKKADSMYKEVDMLVNLPVLQLHAFPVYVHMSKVISEDLLNFNSSILMR